jgi:hypothetical protein
VRKALRPSTGCGASRRSRRRKIESREVEKNIPEELTTQLVT